MQRGAIGESASPDHRRGGGGLGILREENVVRLPKKCTLQSVDGVREECWQICMWASVLAIGSISAACSVCCPWSLGLTSHKYGVHSSYPQKPLPHLPHARVQIRVRSPARAHTQVPSPVPDRCHERTIQQDGPAGDSVRA
jgi:hypothetical protein